VKKSYKSPQNNSNTPNLAYYEYRDKFNAVLCIILARPILTHLKENKVSVMSFIKELNELGLNYNYAGFCNAVRGNNPYIKSFSYFSRIYEYLELPFPSLEYLNSFD
jgi:hypothetical protein